MNTKLKKYDIWIYILAAYIFSIAVRMIWIYQVGDASGATWDNQIMINTNDGYYFATAIKQLLFGTNMDNQLISPAIDTYGGTIYSIYFLAKILPFSLDTIILYAPAFIASLIVVPIILIMRLYDKAFLGFLSALIASVAWSFYNRTMIGYFDTDMYALVFPVFITYFFMKFYTKSTFMDILFASALTSVYVVFYPQGYGAISAIFIFHIMYGFIFAKSIKKDFYISILFVTIALLHLPLVVKIGLFLLLYGIYKKVDLPRLDYYLYVAIGSIFVFLLFSGGVDFILSKIGWYLRTGTVENIESLKFYDVAQTIMEAGNIPFDRLATRISGSTLGFVFSVAGYIWLVIRKREFLLFLPLIAIGFFAYIGGLRFTVYAIPAMSIGAVYLTYTIANMIFKQKKLLQNIFIISIVSLMLYPNISHVMVYRIRQSSVLNKQEVSLLDKLKQISSPKDYTLTWWDYGYPIWYYSETNTLIDGGKHHNDNYIISKILLTPSQRQAANLARLSVETYEKKKLGYGAVANKILPHNNPNKFLRELKSDNFKLPAKTRDIYLYLPHRMMKILQTVELFSNISLKTGRAKPGMIFYPSTPNIKKNGQITMYDGAIAFDPRRGKIKIGRKTYRVKNFDVVTYGRGVQSQVMNLDGQISVVYMRSNIRNHRKMIVMDTKIYKSLYVQMYMLGNYDKSLFDLVLSSPYAKIYKLKI